MHTPNPQFIIPAGTQIVARVEILDAAGNLLCPRGAVGVVTHAPLDQQHTYRILFANGVEAALQRHELTIRKQHQQAGLHVSGDALAEYDLREFVIYRCVVGSRAYGLEHEHSDTDRRGIYLPPADLHWSLYGVPEQLENQETEECYWELQKFLLLALKANPNILECLYTPLVEHATPLAAELLDMREAFLSQLVYQTYNGYVMSQFKKLEQDMRAHGSLKWKHAMHLIRLLYAGIGTLRDGQVPVHVGAQRDELLAIRNGEVAWEEVNALRLRLHQEFDGALNFTRLPEQPAYAKANAFLLKARRAMVKGEWPNAANPD
ncbi:MAG: nucleotidyltransferase domain-containing protein [Acidobacteria bacterium]|nr:nucleotidyltransferase domain-containing protein [Acidobacteriota bacterium]